MSDETGVPVSAQASELGTVDVRHAPLVFFDAVGTFGSYNGIFALTLMVNLSRPSAAGVVNQPAVAAYLRSNREGMLALRDFIDKTLLGDMPAAGEAEGKAN